MKDIIKNFIIAVSLISIPILVIVWCIHMDDKAENQKIGPYEKNRSFSIPMDTSQYLPWEDHFDTMFVKEGITYYQHKNGQF
jgi:hypothetical protein